MGQYDAPKSYCRHSWAFQAYNDIVSFPLTLFSKLRHLNSLFFIAFARHWCLGDIVPWYITLSHAFRIPECKHYAAKALRQYSHPHGVRSMPLHFTWQYFSLMPYTLGNSSYRSRNIYQWYIGTFYASSDRSSLLYHKTIFAFLTAVFRFSHFSLFQNYGRLPY